MDGWMLLLLATGLLAVWVILPLIPAVLIYWLFPNTAVAAEGPFSGLTVKASGAFAGYLIIFAATFPVVQRNLDYVDGLKREYWTVEGKIRFVDKNNKPMRWADHRKNVSMLTNPVTWTIYENYDENDETYDLQLKVLDEGQLPTVTFKLDQFGEGGINLKTAMTKATVQRSKKTIVLNGPIVVKQRSEQPASLTSSSAEVQLDSR